MLIHCILNQGRLYMANIDMEYENINMKMHNIDELMLQML